MTPKHTAAFFVLCLFITVPFTKLQAQNTASKNDTVRIVATPAVSVNASDVVFERTEIEASVNADLWRSHLEKNLQRPIEKRQKQV